MTQGSSSSVTGLVRSAIDDVRELFREELALAKAEVREELSKLTAGSVQAGAACAALWFAAMFALVTVALAITAVFQWPYWAGFAVMAAVLTVVGLALAIGARRSFNHIHAMPRTVATMKENFQ
jgi:uncharacterized membrane protein YqjE